MIYPTSGVQQSSFGPPDEASEAHRMLVVRTPSDLSPQADGPTVLRVVQVQSDTFASEGHGGRVMCGENEHRGQRT